MLLSSIKTHSKSNRADERGNVLIMVFLAVVLIGLLTVAVQNTGSQEGASIDKEQLLIRATEVQRFVSEVERGILYITQQNRQSESDIRFAHPDAHNDYGTLDATPANNTHQIFHRNGGAVRYTAPPDDVNDGSAWEFYGSSAAPNTGSSRADLMAVLPNVTIDFCEQVNALNGQTPTQPLDNGAGAATGADPGQCVYGGADPRFDAGQQFFGTPNTLTNASFTKLPAAQGCVYCADQGTPNYHFYHVILAR